MTALIVVLAVVIWVLWWCFCKRSEETDEPRWSFPKYPEDLTRNPLRILVSAVTRVPIMSLVALVRCLGDVAEKCGVQVLRYAEEYEQEDTATFATLREANIARNHEWVGGGAKMTLSFRGNELAGETGEACNVMKKLERERLGLPGSRDTKEHLAQELADILICVDLIAMDEGIDLNASVTDKFNTTSEAVGLRTRLRLPESAT